MPVVVIHKNKSTDLNSLFITVLEVYNPITEMIRASKMYKVSRIVNAVQIRMDANTTCGTTDLEKSILINNIVENLDLEEYQFENNRMDNPVEDWKEYTLNTSKYFDKEGYRPSLKELIKVLVQREILHIK